MRVKPALLAVNLALAVLFGVFSWMQRNDLDPAIYDRPSVIDAALWLAFYLLIALLLVTTCFRALPRWILLVAALVCLIEMVRTGPGLYENFFGEKEFTMTQSSMSAADPRVELSREFFGAMISLLGVGFLAWQSRRSSVNGDR
jgi:hypothetical protein